MSLQNAELSTYHVLPSGSAEFLIKTDDCRFVKVYHGKSKRNKFCIPSFWANQTPQIIILATTSSCTHPTHEHGPTVHQNLLFPTDLTFFALCLLHCINALNAENCHNDFRDCISMHLCIPCLWRDEVLGIYCNSQVWTFRILQPCRHFWGEVVI